MPPPVAKISSWRNGHFQSFLFLESNGSKDFGKSVTLNLVSQQTNDSVHHHAERC